MLENAPLNDLANLFRRPVEFGQKEPVGCLQEIRGDADELKAFQSKFSDYVKW